MISFHNRAATSSTYRGLPQVEGAPGGPGPRGRLGAPGGGEAVQLPEVQQGPHHGLQGAGPVPVGPPPAGPVGGLRGHRAGRGHLEDREVHAKHVPRVSLLLEGCALEGFS